MEERKAKNSIRYSFANSMSISVLWFEEETEVRVPGQARALCSLASEGLSLSLEQHSDSWIHLRWWYLVLV